MLQRLRERTQGIIATTIIAVICISFALWGIQNYLQEKGGTDLLAKVNDEKISRQQLDSAYQRARQQLMLKAGREAAFDPKTQTLLRQQVAEILINSKALYMEAEKLGFIVSMDQVDAALLQIPIFQINGQFSEARFQQILSNMLYSEHDFVSDLQQNILLSQLHGGIVSSSFALPFEVTDLIKLVKQTRDIDYAIISPTQFLNTIKVTDKEINDYYNNHQQDFTDPEKISINYIELDAESLKNKVHVTEAKLQQFYNENIELYSHPERWNIARIFVPVSPNANAEELKHAEMKINQLAQQAMTGIDFEKIDINYGKPRWILRGEITDDFYDKLQKLQVNKISAPFKTEQGFYIVKIFDQQKAEVVSFDKAKEMVTKNYTKRQLEQLFAEANDKLADLTYTNSSSLDVAAKDLGLDIKSTNLFTAQGEKDGLLSNSKVVETAFSDVVLKQKYNSDVIQIGNDKVVVLRLKQYQPKVIQALVKVRPIIEQKIKIEKANAQAITLGNSLLAEIKNGKNVQQAGLVWHTLSKLEQNSHKINAQVIQRAFDLPLSKDNQAVDGVSLTNGGFAIVRVNKVYFGEPNDVSPQQLAAFAKNYEQSLGENDYQIFIRELLGHAKIKNYTNVYVD